MAELSDLVKYRMERAQETIKIAKELLEKGYYKEANNRSYYAVFYAIKAVYAFQNKDFRKHKTVLAEFNKEFVAEGIFPRSFGRKISKLAIVREHSDYEDFYIVTKEQSNEQYTVAEELVDAISSYITVVLEKQTDYHEWKQQYFEKNE